MTVIAAIAFEFREILIAGIPATLGFLLVAAWLLRRRNVPWPRITTLYAIRAIVFAVLLFLLARPSWIASEAPHAVPRSVALLVDHSESMELDSTGVTRHQQAVEFLRDKLLPALRSADLPVHPMIFAEQAETADAEKLMNGPRTGKRTNLGGAIAQAFATAPSPPLAVIALTDGCANDSSDNNRALSQLLDHATPFAGIGFGSEHGARILSLRQLHAPDVVAAKSTFSISAQIESLNQDALPEFELLLFRDGQLTEKKRVTPAAGSRQWLEHFRVAEEKEGAHRYSVRLLPPEVPHLKVPNNSLTADVRIAHEGDVRVLYIQGAMTWDYKFINLALRDDPSIKVTGLTRTAQQSIFRQNIESAGELLNGFPETLDQVAPFRVIVLSNLKPSDLTPAQQEILAKFCGDLGGGILMIGGHLTFDGSWQNSRLEQLLPVVFSSHPGVVGLDRAFRIEPTDEALHHPVFQLSDSGRTREIWAQLPTFTQYGRVDAAKPGAQVWIRHQTDQGPKGPRILMATQRYGAGISSVLCIQNFWRWRLARDSDPQRYDRFWRQLFRHLSNTGAQPVLIHLPDQELHPDMDVQLVLEKQVHPDDLNRPEEQFKVTVENSRNEIIRETSVTLRPGRPVDFSFHAGPADLYTVSLFDSRNVRSNSRTVEIRDVNLELQRTARNMETLRQWATVSGGLALKAEDCADADEIVRQIKQKSDELRSARQVRRPFGINSWTLALVLGCLTAEWCLRKQWQLR